MKKSLRLLSALILMGVLGFGRPAFASSTATANLSVTASIAASCLITTSPVAFGAYDPLVANLATALDGTGKVTVTCTAGSAGYITLGEGANALGTSTPAVPARQLLKASGAVTDLLTYTLFSGSQGGTVWGNTGTTGLNHDGTGSSTDLTVYGSIGAGQNMPAGSYSDTVLATITF